MDALRLALSLFAVSIGSAACVYSSDAPVPNSSGMPESTQDGTDPQTMNGDAADAGSTNNGGTDGGSANKTDAGSGGKDAGSSGMDGSVVTGPTWTTIYGSYFAASSAGRCGSSGCHSSSRGGFKCGSDKTTCYQGLVSSGYLDTSNPTASALVDKNNTCLAWVSNAGNMPPNVGTDTKATADITAWLEAGGTNN